MVKFELDEDSSIPLWLQLKNRFIYLITSGYYKDGEQLPTVRGLAAEIEVNYNTVSKVYKSLEADGYIESKRRQGAFVCDVSGKPGVSADTTAEIVTREYFKRCQELGLSLDDVQRQFQTVMDDIRGKMEGGDGKKKRHAVRGDGNANIALVELPSGKVRKSS